MKALFWVSQQDGLAVCYDCKMEIGEKSDTCMNCALFILETANADLLEALEEMSSWFDVDGYANSVPPRVFVFKMREAIRKHKGK